MNVFFFGFSPVSVLFQSGKCLSSIVLEKKVIEFFCQNLDKFLSLFSEYSGRSCGLRVECSLYIVQSTLYSVKYAVYTIHCTVISFLCKV